MNHDVGKVIAGALIDAIHQHGPIDKQNVALAEKRVRRALSGKRATKFSVGSPGSRSSLHPWRAYASTSG